MRIYFSVVGSVDLGVLGDFVASYLGLQRERVCVYDNIWDIDPPLEERQAGPLWEVYGRSDVRVQVGHSEPDAGPIGGWFYLEKGSPLDRLDVRAFAHAAAAFLKMPILFPDPAPGDTSQYADAAQIEVTPLGVERKVWLAEFGENGRSRNLIEARD